ncbi:hypothetical protein F4808DRAFT_7660 [Astrocystis sublimbata]|nr:hypothetical protein F4808DRAFT_7660 [Astrocystis sublimbata]
MSQLPDGTLGDAVGVLIFTFICLITNTLLIWLFWINNERWSYIALVGYFALLCTLSSIIQQIYNYTLWNDLAWQQLYYIKANYKNADVIFNNGNFGFMRALAIIRLFCYIVESSYLLAYCVLVTLTMCNFWAQRREAERMFAIFGRIAPIALATITIGLLQTPAVQSSFAAYMVIANVQSVSSCAISIVLLSFVIRQYIMSKLAWRRLSTRGESGSLWSRLRNNTIGSSNGTNGSNNGTKDQAPNTPTVAPAFTARGTVFDNNWVVVRLTIAVAFISVFIVANIATHLPQADDVARDAKADAPDLGPERASSNIIGYIFGVTPGLTIWIVFGLTRDFRKIMYETFVPRRWRKRLSSPASPLEASWSAAQGRQQANLSGVTVETVIQLDDIKPNTKRRPLPDKMDAPLLTSTSTSRLAPSDRSIPKDEAFTVV